MQTPRPGYKLVKSLFGKYEEIPEEWEIMMLKDIADLSAGGTPSRFNSKYWDNGTIPWLSSGEIRNNVICDSNEKITFLGLEESAARLFPKGTVLIAITGQGLTRGRTALLDIDASSNQSVIGIICKNNIIYNLFLWYCLQNQYWQLRSISQGSNQAGLNLNLLKTYTVFSPKDIPEQQKIASILSNVDSLIDQTQKEIEQAQKLKKGLMQKLLTRGIGHTRFKKVKSLFGKY
ncbi:MAG: restriction endonuclease subunit S, partial [Nitrosopumilus sp.]|nr:restriction endonuclease subunit S [Nitrosopumilus sp.]